MRYPLASETWGDEEKTAAKNVIDSGMCTMGKKVLEFEKEFAKHFDTKYAVMSNSGSSANLLMVSAFKLANNIEDGSEIIVPAVSWSTTYYPIHQSNLKCVFVDIDLDTLNISPEKIEQAITPKTKAILAVNLLGVPCDFDAILKICKKHKLTLLIDNCESMGATYKNKEVGTIGYMGSYSTFFSHHMCTIEGGVTVTNDEKIYHHMISLRAHGWIRGLPDKNHVCNKTGDVFTDSFRFVLPGYNLRPNEVFGAIGTEQLKKLPSFLADRRENHKYFSERISKSEVLNKLIRLQRGYNNGDPSWFGFSMILEGKFAGQRKLVTGKLIDANIECRPIVAGNFTKNPVMKLMKTRTCGKLTNAEKIDVDGLFVGNNAGNIKPAIDFLIRVLEETAKSLFITPPNEY